MIEEADTQIITATITIPTAEASPTTTTIKTITTIGKFEFDVQLIS